MSQLNIDQDIKNDNNVLNNGTVDKDIMADSNLLNNSDTVQDIKNQTLTTEVTSIAKQEGATGQKQPNLTPEELYSRASMSFIRNMQHINTLIKAKSGSSYKISRKGMNRLLNSILQLPIDNIPVTLQGEDEKLAFGLGQRAIADRYLITHFHILEEKKKLQEKNNVSNTQQQVAETKENV